MSTPSPAPPLPFASSIAAWSPGALTPEARIRFADARSAQLETLHTRLASLATEVADGRSLVPGANPAWRSASARAYRGRVDEVRSHLRRAAALLDEAVGRIAGRLSALRVEKGAAQAELSARRSLALLHQEAARGLEGRRYE